MTKSTVILKIEIFSLNESLKLRCCMIFSIILLNCESRLNDKKPRDLNNSSSNRNVQ